MLERWWVTAGCQLDVSSDIPGSVTDKSRLHISRGQYVIPEKLRLAREFRGNPTPDEETLWKALRSDRLAGLHFRRQQVISGYIADFYCASARLAVELDGPVHNERTSYDRDRDRAFKANGIRTLRIVSNRVQSELAVVLEEIRKAYEDLTP